LVAFVAVPLVSVAADTNEERAKPRQAATKKERWGIIAEP
jgi:hypothetical protein